MRFLRRHEVVAFVIDAPHQFAFIHMAGNDRHLTTFGRSRCIFKTIKAQTCFARDVKRCVIPVPIATQILLAHDQRHIASVGGPLSCQRIVEVVQACGKTLADAPVPPLLERGKTYLELKKLWFKRFLRLYTSSRGRQRRRFLREKYPALKPYQLDFSQLRYSEQQFDLLMRQFPPLTTGELDARIRGYAGALGKFDGFRSAVVGNNLFTIVR